MHKTGMILIISPEAWSAHFVSKHHYAMTLAKQGYKVYFLSPADERVRDVRIETTKYENLWSVTAPRVAKGLRFYPGFLRNFVEKRWLKRLESTIGERFTAVWLFENSRFYDMAFAGDRLKIYHQVDLNQNFHVREAALSADICFCTTDHILEKIRPYNVRVFKIHHGVNLFPKTAALSEEQHEHFLPQKVNATYIGNLGMQYLDVELLAKAVSSFPQVQFQFVGGYDQDTPLYQACKDAVNVTWWGKVDSELIPSILKQSDLLMVCYQEKHYIDQASPHKIMEYLSSGKVTVATYTGEYKDKCHLLEMAKTHAGYLETFHRVISDLAYYNSSEKEHERITFAEDHTYARQLEKIEACLKKFGLSLWGTGTAQSRDTEKA